MERILSRRRICKGSDAPSRRHASQVGILDNAESDPRRAAPPLSERGGFPLIGHELRSGDHCRRKDKLASYPQGADVSSATARSIKGGSPDVYMWFRTANAGCWRPPRSSSGSATAGPTWLRPRMQSANDAAGPPAAPDPLLATVGLTVTPDWPAVGKPATAAFTLENTGNYPITLQALRADVTGAPFPSRPPLRCRRKGLSTTASPPPSRTPAPTRQLRNIRRMASGSRRHRTAGNRPRPASS